MLKEMEGVEVVKASKKVSGFQPSLVYLSLLPIGLGILKLVLHYYSPFRSGFLDYLVGVGPILGGLFLFSRRPSKLILLISGSWIAIEVFKAIVDYRDIFDVSLVIITVIYLSIPLARDLRERARST